MKYAVVQGNDVDELCSEVNRLISEGWRPIGGAHTTSLGGQMIVTQSMVCSQGVIYRETKQCQTKFEKK